MPLVSIIVPCFNQGHLLGETLESVSRQTHQTWECIIVDDGSTDVTARVANEFVQRDARFRYVLQGNKGVSAARNEGLLRATGQFIQFLDADDLLAPEKLEIQIASLAGAPTRSLAFCDYRFGHGPGARDTLRIGELDRPRFNGTDLMLELIGRWETDLTIPPMAFLFDNSLFREPELQFDTTLPTHEDWDCWLRVLMSGAHVVHNRREMAVYRIHPGSKSTELREMWIGMRMVCHKHSRIHAERSIYALAWAQKWRSMRVTYMARMLRAVVSKRTPWLMALYRRLPWGWQQFVRFRLGLSR